MIWFQSILGHPGVSRIKGVAEILRGDDYVKIVPKKKSKLGIRWMKGPYLYM